MINPLICHATTSQLVVVDVQEKLCSAMPPEHMATTLRYSQLLLKAARMLEIPVIYTEQYPKGLGATHPTLIDLLKPAERVEKTVFSCCDHPGFSQKLTTDRPQIILAGMEAHICILQTALALQAKGRQVFVAEDAVLSRNPQHKANALLRLRQSGVIVSNAESIIFEWLGKAEGESFKQLSKLIR